MRQECASKHPCAKTVLASQMSPRRKLRVLALHSFRTSAETFREQLTRAGLLSELEELMDITFVDAPNPASGPIPDDVAPHFPPPYYEWWNAKRDAEGRWTYENSDVALTFLSDVLKLHGPFDGLMGFSQGAGVASLLAGMQRSGKLLNDTPLIRFLVLFAGIRVRDPRLEEFYRAMTGVPSIHIIGDKDPVKVLTNMLIDSFESPVVIRHTRGHVIPPLQGHDLQRLKAFINGQLTESAL